MIDLFRPFVSPAAKTAVAEVLTPDSDGRIYLGEGPKVAEFEQGFQSLTGFRALALNSGTSALELALYLTGVQIGTDVVTTAMTCTATNGAIRRLRGTPVWADVDPLTGLIDPDDVVRKVTRRTKAIMAVDWAGKSASYNQIRRRLPDIPIIQDAAHNLLVDPKNHGDYICWSFQAIKHLTTGDGGALHVPERQHERARLLRWYGLDRTSGTDFRCAQNITEAGWKAHMNDIAASIGLANLPHALRVVALHRANAAWYEKAFYGINPNKVILPAGDAGSSWWLYTLLVDDRPSFQAHMADKGIMVSPVHKRNDGHTAFRFPNGPLPGLDYFDSHEVAIPVGWWVGEQDREHVAAAVWEWTTKEAGVETPAPELAATA
jgi:dTDP-4-amino-4,6-dideoxygalactose transaminase